MPALNNSKDSATLFPCHPNFDNINLILQSDVINCLGNANTKNNNKYERSIKENDNEGCYSGQFISCKL